MNVTNAPGFPLQLVAGTEQFGVTQGTWTWWGTMLYYDHGTEWQMFFMCQMPHGKTGIFLYIMPYVLITTAGCSYSMPSQAGAYPLQLFNVPQFSEAFLVYDRILCCIICTLHVSTVCRLLRLFLGMNCPVYTFHEHRNTKQAEESHRHSYWLLQVSQRRYFVCNLKQSGSTKHSASDVYHSRRYWQHVSASSFCKQKSISAFQWYQDM